MGMGDRLIGMVDEVAEALDCTPQEREELEQLISQDPSAFLEEYGRYLSKDDRELLFGGPGRA